MRPWQDKTDGRGRAISRALFEERVEEAGHLLSDALDIYADLWDLFPGYREELKGKTLSIVDVFQKTMRDKQAI